MEPVTHDFNTSLMHRKQIIHLVLLFLMSVPFFVLAFLMRESSHGESYGFLFFGFIIVLPFVIAFIRYLMLRKRTIRGYQITSESVIKINDDSFDLREKTLFFVPGTGFMRLFWFFPRRLCVMDTDQKTVAYYYCGIAADSKTSSEIEDFIGLCHVICEAVKHELTAQEVQEEMDNRFDVVTIRFPLRSIRNEFYKTGSLPLIFGVLGYVLSFCSFDDPMISGASMKFLRCISIICIFVGFLFALLFLLKYRITPKKIEIRKEYLTIDGKVLDKNRISNIRMSQKNTLLTRGEEDSWLFIRYEDRWLRYFLGQAKNSDCFEARRRLTSAIRILMGDEENSADPDTDVQDETSDM